MNRLRKHFGQTWQHSRRQVLRWLLGVFLAYSVLLSVPLATAQTNQSPDTAPADTTPVESAAVEQSSSNLVALAPSTLTTNPTTAVPALLAQTDVWPTNDPFLWLVELLIALGVGFFVVVRDAGGKIVQILVSPQVRNVLRNVVPFYDLLDPLPATAPTLPPGHRVEVHGTPPAGTAIPRPSTPNPSQQMTPAPVAPAPAAPAPTIPSPSPAEIEVQRRELQAQIAALEAQTRVYRTQQRVAEAELQSTLTELEYSHRTNAILEQGQIDDARDALERLPSAQALMNDLRQHGPSAQLRSQVGNVLNTLATLEQRVQGFSDLSDRVDSQPTLALIVQTRQAMQSIAALLDSYDHITTNSDVPTGTPPFPAPQPTAPDTEIFPDGPVAGLGSNDGQLNPDVQPTAPAFLAITRSEAFDELDQIRQRHDQASAAVERNITDQDAQKVYREAVNSAQQEAEELRQQISQAIKQARFNPNVSREEVAKLEQAERAAKNLLRELASKKQSFETEVSIRARLRTQEEVAREAQQRLERIQRRFNWTTTAIGTVVSIATGFFTWQLVKLTEQQAELARINTELSKLTEERLSALPIQGQAGLEQTQESLRIQLNQAQYNEILSRRTEILQEYQLARQQFEDQLTRYNNAQAEYQTAVSAYNTAATARQQWIDQRNAYDNYINSNTGRIRLQRLLEEGVAWSLGDPIDGYSLPAGPEPTVPPSPTPPNVPQPTPPQQPALPPLPETPIGLPSLEDITIPNNVTQEQLDHIYKAHVAQLKRALDLYYSTLNERNQNNQPSPNP
ncbi:MAG: hypothetical protein MI924_22235 [Chloroflexales bacterium]|nr:hypothetical protein [Chloroflexales bacterium]